MSQISQALGLPPQKENIVVKPGEKIKFGSDQALSSIKSAPTEKATLPQKMRQEDESMEALHKKLADLKQELEMSPRQFEDKLLHKLKQEIQSSKQQMQEQLQSELSEERDRMKQRTNKTKDNLQKGNKQLQKEANRLKNIQRGQQK